jgi:hypothetical protein
MGILRHSALGLGFRCQQLASLTDEVQTDTAAHNRRAMRTKKRLLKAKAKEGKLLKAGESADLKLRDMPASYEQLELFPGTLPSMSLTVGFDCCL